MIKIYSIPHKKQRYATVGDWYVNKKKDLLIPVSDTGNKYYNVLLGIHELVEAVLCEARSIDEEDVTAFDKAHPDDDDPGLNPNAPYHKEHMAADIVERFMCQQLGLSWKDYEDTLDKVWNEK